MEPYFIASIIGISAGTRLEIAIQNLRADGELSLDIPGHSIEAEFFDFLHIWEIFFIGYCG